MTIKISSEKLDSNGFMDWFDRLKKENPTFGAKPEDFGFVGDGRKGDAKAMQDYQAYLSALTPSR